MPDEPGPHDEPAESQATPSVEMDLSPIDTVPFRLGFEETEPMQEAKAAVLEAMAAGTSEELQDAWVRWSELAEAQADAHDRDGRARAGLLVVKAAILKEAGEIVSYLVDLNDAYTYLFGMGLVDIATAVGNEFKPYRQSGELLESQRFFDAALDIYIEHEQEDLTDKERGLLNLRMAECYIGLRDSPDPYQEDPDPELLEGSVATAMECLTGEPEQMRVIRFMDEHGL